MANITEARTSTLELNATELELVENALRTHLEHGPDRDNDRTRELMSDMGVDVD